MSVSPGVRIVMRARFSEISAVVRKLTFARGIWNVFTFCLKQRQYIMLLVFALILLVSLARAGRLHPQVKKELDELQLVFGDLGIPHQDLTALATELATKADEADAEALLYRDFKRRLSDGKLRAKFDEKLRQLHQYNDFVEKLVEAVGGENVAEDGTNEATLNGELQALEEHIREISEDVKHGNKNRLFVRLSNLLNEFEKNNSKAAFKTTNLSSSKSKKLNVRSSDDTTADVEENSDRLSVKKTAISKGDQGQWIINGNPWPKDSLHHIPKWLEDEYKRRGSKGETESLEEEDSTRSTTMAVEDEYIKNRVVTNKVSRFNLYKQKIVASTEKENTRSTEEEDEGFLEPSNNVKNGALRASLILTEQERFADRNTGKGEGQAHKAGEETQDKYAQVSVPEEIRTTKASAGTDILTADNNRDSADEEPDSSGEELSSKGPRKHVVGETEDEMGEGERSERPEISGEQGNITIGDSESSELGDVNLHMQMASEKKLNKQPGEDSESAPWEPTKKTLSEQKTDKGNGEQSGSFTTTPNNDGVDSMFSESPPAEKTFDMFTEGSTSASHSRSAETTPGGMNDDEHRSLEARDWTNSEQFFTSSTTHSLGLDGVNEIDSPLQNEALTNQVTQVSGTLSTTRVASLEPISYSEVLRRSEVNNEPSVTVRNEAVDGGEEPRAIQTTVDEGYTASQSTSANAIEEEGIEDISAIDVVTITTKTMETTKIPEASAVLDTLFTEVTSIRTTEQKANESSDTLGITDSTEEGLVVKNLSTELRVERDKEMTGKSEEVKASTNQQSALSKEHTSEQERIEEPLRDIDLQAVGAILNVTALSSDMNITKYERLAGDDSNMRNGTGTDYDMKELTLNEPDDHDGSGEEEIA